jgi:type I restriction enzyme R subunit
MIQVNENTVEEAALSWFGNLGYATAHGEQLAPGEPGAERQSYGDVVLVGRLRDAIERLNSTIPASAREDALRKVLTPDSPSLIVNNRKFHRMLRDGVEVEYNRPDGSIAGDRVRLAGDDPAENDFLAVNQFTVQDGQHHRRPDLVVFLNGLPVCVFELKECPGRRCDDLGRLEPTPNLQGANPGPVRVQRTSGHFGWSQRSRRIAHRREGMV